MNDNPCKNCLVLAICNQKVIQKAEETKRTIIRCNMTFAKNMTVEEHKCFIIVKALIECPMIRDLISEQDPQYLIGETPGYTNNYLNAQCLLDTFDIRIDYGYSKDM